MIISLGNISYSSCQAFNQAFANSRVAQTLQTWACRKKLITASDFERAIGRHKPQNIDIQKAARRVTSQI